MSTHLLIAAAYLEKIPQGRKLVLMAMADSADEHTLEAAPGLPKLRAWSGLGKSSALDAVRQLVDDGVLERIAAGRFNRRAVYRVFPAGVPAIPHPTEVAARYETPGSGQPDPTEDSTVVHNSESYPQDDAAQGPASRTHRVRNDGARVRPAGPLQSSTSVSIGSAPQESTGPLVDKSPTTSATVPRSSPFPGARAADRPDPRTKRGAHNQPCPFHPEQIVPCGRCAHAAANSDPALIADAKATARAALRANKTAPPPEAAAS